MPMVIEVEWREDRAIVAAAATARTTAIRSAWGLGSGSAPSPLHLTAGRPRSRSTADLDYPVV